ncbi:MAG TPA: hypothetical protein VKT76_01220 [Bradyrhizobium sp.]|nr:hypothetical protein [Bradyrhizobium sp.]
MTFFRQSLHIVLALLFLGWAWSASAEERKDTLADLDALAAAHSWRELGEHLMDIPPAARASHWQGLVEQAAIGELTSYANAAGSFVDRLNVIARYYPIYPSLAQSENFIELRAKIGLSAFRQCFEAADTSRVSAEACRNHLWDFVRAKPLRYDVASAAAEMVAKKFAQATAAPFLAIGAQAPGGEEVCTHAKLNDATLAGLGQEAEEPEAKAARYLLGKCWDKLQAVVVEAFAKESPGSFYMKNTCPTLMEHNALTGLRASRCKGLEKAG